MPKTEHYRIGEEEIRGIKVMIKTYQIGDRFYCHIENTDPGATISRAEGSTLEEARKQAISNASDRL